MKRLILASASPRRKELLEQARIPFSIQTSSIQEKVDESLPPQEVVQSLASQKADAVAKRFPGHVVLGSDTVVVYENHILGKPHNKEDARRMLKLLSGAAHSVFTGVALVSKESRTVFFTETKVTFWDLSEDEIELYLETNQPYDKAGSYGIQDFGATFVKWIDGDYFAVVGLPLSSTIRELRKYGIYSTLG